MEGAEWETEQQPALVPQIDPSVAQPVFTITEKAPTRAFSWLKGVDPTVSRREIGSPTQ